MDNPITAQDVLDALEKADAGDDVAPVVPEPVKPVVVDPVKPVVVDPIKPSGNDEAMALAWEMATDAVKARCPDLDDEAISLARDAAGGSPLKFKQVAEKLQGKISKAKEGKPVNDQAALEAEVARRIHSGAPAGGDAAVVPAKGQQTAADKMAEAVKDPKREGTVMRLLVDVLNEGKLLKDTTVG